MQPEVETGGTKEEDDRRVTLGSAYFLKARYDWMTKHDSQK